MTEPNFHKAKYLATLILQCSSLAELYLKDYEAEMRKQGYESKQRAKQLILANADNARRLMSSLQYLEKQLTVKINEEQEDCFLDDVGFLHNMLLLLIDRCGDNEQKRLLARASIFNIKSELNLKI